jgi:lysozyme family protein
MRIPKWFQNYFYEWILKVEGEYVNDKRDAGGETKYGISKKQYPKENIKKLTKQRAIELYYRDYYLNFKLNELPQSLSLALMDFYINTSSKNVNRSLQRTINYYGKNLKVDGVVGRKTRTALTDVLGSAGIKNFTRQLITERELFYTRLKSFKYYGKGWIRRAIRLRRYLNL